MRYIHSSKISNLENTFPCSTLSSTNLLSGHVLWGYCSDLFTHTHTF